MEEPAAGPATAESADAALSATPPAVEDNPVPQPREDDPFVRGTWHVAMAASALGRGRMLARTFFGEPILFARRDDGSVFAIKDLCPHRGIPLRYGRFDGDTVQCCYHGWRFDGAGRCVHLPSLSDQAQVDLQRIRCGAYPCAERQGLIWIYLRHAGETEDADPPPPEPFPDFEDDAPKAAISLTYETDFDNAAFGMFDPAHIAFVHSAWWMPKKMAAELPLKEKTFEPFGLGWRMATHPIRKITPFHRLLGRRVETEITIRLPGFRIERVFGERHRLVNLLAITPIDAGRTQMFQALWWSMPGLDWAGPMVRAGARRFLNQDAAVIEKHNVGLAFNPTQMLIADADAQTKWWLRVKREWRASRAEGRAFENPLKPQTLRYRS